MKGIGEGLAKASVGLEMGRSAITGPVGRGDGSVTRLHTEGSKGQEYIQNGWEPLLPTLQGIHQPAKTEQVQFSQSK